MFLKKISVRQMTQEQHAAYSLRNGNAGSFEVCTLNAITPNSPCYWVGTGKTHNTEAAAIKAAKGMAKKLDAEYIGVVV